MTRTISSTSLLLGALAGAVVGVWLAFDNPEIMGTSRDVDGGYTCLAPWDTVLNDADNLPGGEPPRDAEDIAERCRAAGELQFYEAAAVVVASGSLAGLGAAVRRRERAAAPDALGGNE